jgi:HTH-type transcriptional regulator/antitoxin HigA
MPTITAINNDDDLDSATERIGQLLRSEEGSSEYEELQALTALVIAYEDIHYPIPAPSPLGRIEGRMDALGLSEDDLIPCIGSREDVDDVLTGRREITPEMAEALHQLLGIDLDLLLQEPAAPRG